MRYLHVGSQTDMSRPPSHLDQTLVGKDQFFGVRDPRSHRCSSPCWSCWAAANGVDWGRSHRDKGLAALDLLSEPGFWKNTNLISKYGPECHLPRNDPRRSIWDMEEPGGIQLTVL